MVNVVVRAIEYEGEWPVVGGIRGDRVTMRRLVALGERLRGHITVERYPFKDLEDGTWEPTSMPVFDHPGIPAEMIPVLSKKIVAAFMMAIPAKNFEVGDEWNKLLPDYEFENADEFLDQVWEGKP